jgi:hypothetical protein
MSAPVSNLTVHLPRLMRAEMDSISKDSHYDLVEKKTQKSQKTRYGCSLVTISAGIALVVVLTLALGLGLGLGLKKTHQSPSISNDIVTAPADLALSSKLSPLKPTPEDNFVLGTIIGQPPQTRRYHFTVSEVQGAPDGVSKPMLVVNGTIISTS